MSRADDDAVRFATDLLGVFGERSREMSDELRARLRELWSAGRVADLSLPTFELDPNEPVPTFATPRPVPGAVHFDPRATTKGDARR